MNRTLEHGCCKNPICRGILHAVLINVSPFDGNSTSYFYSSYALSLLLFRFLTMASEIGSSRLEEFGRG